MRARATSSSPSPCYPNGRISKDCHLGRCCCRAAVSGSEEAISQVITLWGGRGDVHKFLFDEAAPIFSLCERLRRNPCRRRSCQRCNRAVTLLGGLKCKECVNDEKNEQSNNTPLPGVKRPLMSRGLPRPQPRQPVADVEQP